MSTILSTEGKDQLLLEGCRYRRDRLTWRCIKDNCKDRVCHSGIAYEMYQNHACQAPNPEEIEKFEYSYEIRRKTENSHDKPRLLIQESRVKLSSKVTAIIPQYTSFQRSIQRIRKGNNMPKEPAIFDDILIPLEYQVTTSNQQFLLYDNNGHDNRLLIFANKEQLDLLNGCEIYISKVSTRFEFCLSGSAYEPVLILILAVLDAEFYSLSTAIICKRGSPSKN